MTSGKATKRKRRQAAAAPPPVRAPGQRRQASPKVLIGAAAAVVLIVVAIVLGFVLTGGDSSSGSTPARGSLVNALPSAAEVNDNLKGIPQQGNVLGSPNAPVTLAEYIDLQCPACQQFETRVMPDLIRQYVRTGKVKVDARPIAFIGPDSVTGRAAALAAAKQNRFFNFSQLLYFNQGIENTGWLNDAMIKAAAASIPGLDVPRLLNDRTLPTISDQASAFDTQADQDNVTGTPTILVGKSSGPLRAVPSDTASISAAIAAAQR
jgi:protein-disulfide isomerase